MRREDHGDVIVEFQQACLAGHGEKAKQIYEQAHSRSRAVLLERESYVRLDTGQVHVGPRCA